MKLNELKGEIAKLANEKGWNQVDSANHQSAKNLAISVSIEASELLECYQWEEHANKRKVAEELADIIIYAAQLSNVIDLDLDKAVSDKLKYNRTRSWK